MLKLKFEGDDLLTSAGRKVLYGFICAALSASSASVVASAMAQTWWEAGYRTPSMRASSVVSNNHMARVGAEISSTSAKKPNIVRVMITGKEVNDNGLYGCGALEVLLGNEVQIDADGTFVRLYDKDGKQIETTYADLSDEIVYAKRVGFSLEDGSYGKVECVVRSLEGKEAAVTFSHIDIDTKAPEVTFEYYPSQAVETLQGWQYFNAAQRLSVTLKDPHLDAKKTTLNGSTLAELVGQGDGASDPHNPGITYTSWESVQDNEGEDIGYNVTMTFADGSYRLPLVDATDEAENHSLQEALTWNGAGITGFTVDAKAPQVMPYLDRSPIRVVNEPSTGRPVAFFNAPTTLKLQLFDALSGVSQVDDLAGYDLRRTYEESGKLVGVSLELPEGEFADDVRFHVRDLTRNELVWSIGPEGSQIVGGTESAARNAPLILEGNSEPAVPDGHALLLVKDTTAPTLVLEGADDGLRTNQPQSLTLTASDAFLGYATVFDPDQTILSISRDGKELESLSRKLADCESPNVCNTSATYCVDIPANKETHENDGVYEVRASIRDLAGNEASLGEETAQTFIVDTVAPELEVSFDDEEVLDRAKERGWFGAKRTARILVRDKSLRVEKLNEGGLVHVEPTARDGHGPSDVAVSAWQEGNVPHEYWCEVEFPADGSYSLVVYGADEAGNALKGRKGTEVDELGKYESGVFTIDTTPPQVVWEYAPDTQVSGYLSGEDYFSHPASVRFMVKDRNLDLGATTITDSEGRVTVPDWTEVEHTDDGLTTYVATVAYREEETGTGAGRKIPRVQARDLVGNVTHEEVPSFVVDQTAPTLDEVRVSKPSDTEGRDDAQDDPYLFFNEHDGVPATITFVFSDEYLVETAWVMDPDGVYDIQQQGPYRKQSGSLTLALKDFEEDGAWRDVDMDRDVRLYVRDVAGNVREWTCDRTGAIVADRVTSSANVSLDGRGIYPYALIKDTTAPLVGMSGIEGGHYYNTPQTEHIEISEHNFEYLTRFDPKRSVVMVHRGEGSAATPLGSWVITAEQFAGTSPHYSYDQVFNEDGRYSIEASFEDYAGNPSQRSLLSEFIIDQTAPVISVMWDNRNVHNGRYYNASRTATIAVVERNFDPALIAIDTTGAIGEWLSNGDVHTCEVAFRTDAPLTNPHRLAVRGSDKAGNAANPCVEPDFAIDTQAPSVSILKRASEGDRMEAGQTETELVDGSAFSGAIIPMVKASDESGLDVHGLEVSLLGLREGAGEAQRTLQHVQMQGGNVERVDWGNLGLVESEDGPYYALSADDVYTLRARAIDLAGNTSEEALVSFSVNRYGSNYFFEESGGLRRDEDGSWDATPLMDAPRIVVHEVNVSGALDERGDTVDESHTVTKEYANATSVISRTQEEEQRGYTLSSTTKASATNPYEGWTEYVYTIQPGNFGRGSDTDYGDGGQGTYRVDVSSRDKAQNNNTTAEYWGSGVSRTGASDDEGIAQDLPEDKTATVRFTLDQDGPKVEDVVVPKGVVAGGDYTASFRVMDQITNGDYVSVTVDGEPVEVYGEGMSEPVSPGESVQQGTYTFDIAAKSVFDPREVEIHVSDYTGLEERSQTVRLGGFRLTTLVAEVALLIGAVLAGFAACLVVKRKLKAAEPEAPLV